MKALRYEKTKKVDGARVWHIHIASAGALGAKLTGATLTRVTLTRTTLVTSIANFTDVRSGGIVGRRCCADADAAAEY